MKPTFMVHNFTYLSKLPSSILIAKKGPVVFYGLWGHNSGVQQYIHLFDVPATPKDHAGYANTGVVFDKDNDTIALASHGLTDQSIVRFSQSEGLSYGGIEPQEWYYTKDVDGDSFEIYHDSDLTELVDLTADISPKLWTPKPFAVFLVPASSNFAFDAPQAGVQLMHGLVVCNSSTSPHLTIGGNDCYFTAFFAD